MSVTGQRNATDSWLDDLLARLKRGRSGGGGDGDAVELHLAAEELASAPPMEEVFDRLAGRPYSCFLDSSLVMERLGRHSFIAFDPFLVLSTRGYRCAWRGRGGGPGRRRRTPSVPCAPR